MSLRYADQHRGSEKPGGGGLFAGQFAVETGKGDAKGLKRTHRVVVVHGEHILRHTAKLHHDVVHCKTGTTGLSHSATQ